MTDKRKENRVSETVSETSAVGMMTEEAKRAEKKLSELKKDRRAAAWLLQFAEDAYRRSITEREDAVSEISKVVYAYVNSIPEDKLELKKDFDRLREKFFSAGERQEKAKKLIKNYKAGAAALDEKIWDTQAVLSVYGTADISSETKSIQLTPDEMEKLENEMAANREDELEKKILKIKTQAEWCKTDASALRSLVDLREECNRQDRKRIYEMLEKARALENEAREMEGKVPLPEEELTEDDMFVAVKAGSEMLKKILVDQRATGFPRSVLVVADSLEGSIKVKDDDGGERVVKIID